MNANCDDLIPGIKYPGTYMIWLIAVDPLTCSYPSSHQHNLGYNSIICHCIDRFNRNQNNHITY